MNTIENDEVMKENNARVSNARKHIFMLRTSQFVTLTPDTLPSDVLTFWFLLPGSVFKHLTGRKEDLLGESYFLLPNPTKSLIPITKRLARFLTRA